MISAYLNKKLGAAAVAGAAAFSAIAVPTAPAAHADTVAPAPAASQGGFYRNEYTYTYTYDVSPKQITVAVGGDWTYEITQGGELITVAKSPEGNLIITPKRGANGTAIVVVKDARGVQYKYTIAVDTTKTIQQVTTPTTTSYTYVWSFDGAAGAGSIQIPQGGRWEIVSGGELVSTRVEGDQLIVTPNADANGREVVIAVKDKDGNTLRYAITMHLKPGGFVSVDTLESGGTVTFQKRGPWKITQGSELIDVTETSPALTITAKDSVRGTAIIEMRDSNGREFQHQINVIDTTPVVQEWKVNLYDDMSYNLPRPASSTYRLVSGAEAVAVKENGKFLEVTGKEGSNGTAVVELLDQKSRVTARYRFEVISTDQRGEVREINNQITDRTEFLATKRGQGTTLLIESGGALVDAVVNPDGSVTLHPTQGANGTVVIVEKDQRGQVVTRYNVTIKPVPIQQVTHDIESNRTIDVTGSNLVVVRGEELVTLDKRGDTWTVVPKEGASGTVVIEGRDDRGRTQVRYTINITAAQVQVEQREETNASLNGIEVGGGPGDSPVPSPPPSNGTGTGVAEERPVDNSVRNSNNITNNTTNNSTSNGPVTNNTNTDNSTHIVNHGVKDGAAEGGKEGSNPGGGQPTKRGSLDGKCTAALVGAASPLLLLMPLGLLTQVRIPGLEQLQAQINGAIQDANTQLQQGLGIFDEERAKRAAGINSALAGVDTRALGTAAGSLALVAAGLVVGGSVWHACADPADSKATTTKTVDSKNAAPKGEAAAGSKGWSSVWVGLGERRKAKGSEE